MDESDKDPELTDGDDTPEKSTPEHSDEPVSMYPLIPDGEESEIEYGDIGFREEEIGLSPDKGPGEFQYQYFMKRMDKKSCSIKKLFLI